MVVNREYCKSFDFDSRNLHEKTLGMLTDGASSSFNDSFYFFHIINAMSKISVCFILKLVSYNLPVKKVVSAR